MEAKQMRERCVSLAIVGCLGLSLGVAGCGSSAHTGTTGTAGHGGAGTTGTAGAAGGLGAAGGASGMGGSSAVGDSVLTHHKNASRDGVYVEPALTKTAAAGLRKDTTFTSMAVEGQVYAQPLFVDGGGSRRDLLIVATEANNVYAFDAANGSQVWLKNLGNSVPLAQMPCGNIDTYGITSTPVIDLASRTLFVGAMTSPDDGTTKKHLIFALSIDDGTIQSGWPVDVGAKAQSGSTTFNVAPQSQRGALAFVNGTVYVSYGGLFGDCGNYHGWLVAVSAADPSNVQAWATSAKAGGIWAPGGVASDGTNVYVTTGNTEGATVWSGGEALLRFTPGASFASPAYWAPSNWVTLDTDDVDIGGSGPVLFDLQGSVPSALALALGKDGNAYLLDRNGLAGVGAPLATLHAASNQIINAAAVYTTATATYAAFRGNGTSCTSGSGSLTTVKLVPGSPPTIAGSWCATGGSGSPMVTTSDGHADAIVWTLGVEADNLLHGFDGDTGAAVFTGGGVSISGLHRFNTPIAAKGRIFVAADSGVVAFTP